MYVFIFRKCIIKSFLLFSRYVLKQLQNIDSTKQICRFSPTQVIINFAQFYDEKEKDDDEDAFEVMHQNRNDAHFAIVVERR